jgi:hypothetical protein
MSTHITHSTASAVGKRCGIQAPVHAISFWPGTRHACGPLREEDIRKQGPVGAESHTRALSLKA